MSYTRAIGKTASRVSRHGMAVNAGKSAPMLLVYQKHQTAARSPNNEKQLTSVPRMIICKQLHSTHGICPRCSSVTRCCCGRPARKYHSKTQLHPQSEKKTLSASEGPIITGNFPPLTTTPDEEKQSTCILRLEEHLHASTCRVFSLDDVGQYARLVQDYNPIHLSRPLPSCDDKQRPALVHGMLSASLFSSILATLIPGCVYRSQTLQFAAPVYVDEVITGKITVLRWKVYGRRGTLLTCRTEVTKECQHEEKKIGQKKEWDERSTQVCITGEAEVWLPRILVPSTQENIERTVS